MQVTYYVSVLQVYKLLIERDCAKNTHSEWKSVVQKYKVKRKLTKPRSKFFLKKPLMEWSGVVVMYNGCAFSCYLLVSVCIIRSLG